MSELLPHRLDHNFICMVCGENAHQAFTSGAKELSHCLILVEPIYTLEYKIKLCMCDNYNMYSAHAVLQEYADAGATNAQLYDRIYDVLPEFLENDHADDFLRDCLDMTYGFCAPEWRIKFK